MSDRNWNFLAVAMFVTVDLQIKKLKQSHYTPRRRLAGDEV
jgi:hypothetical protein